MRRWRQSFWETGYFLNSLIIAGVTALLSSTFGLFETRIGLILALTSITLPFSVWMLKGYIEAAPAEND